MQCNDMLYFFITENPEDVWLDENSKAYRVSLGSIFIELEDKKIPFPFGQRYEMSFFLEISKKVCRCWQECLPITAPGPKITFSYAISFSLHSCSSLVRMAANYGSKALQQFLKTILYFSPSINSSKKQTKTK